ncbi:MAG: geranylgeranyl reductase family protein [Aquificaceae bacterium]
MRFDAIVVGGGPAGASSAYHLSRKGLKVLLIEKENLPRFKLCAGCISARAIRLLPDGYQRLILNTIRAGRLGFRGLEETRAEAEGAVAHIVDRRDFDHFLVSKALEAGAELLRAEFLGFEREDEGYRVYTSWGTFEADLLVGADGFYSKVAKLLGYRKKKFFRSLELFTDGDMEDEVLIETGYVGRGYLWVFPHGDGISLGVASTGREDLLRILKDYSEKKGIKFHHPRGWHIPFVERDEDLHAGRERILLVGDAANMTDPLLGEGIYYALWGGKLLAEAIVENPSEPVGAYRKRLRPLVQELVYAGRIARLAYAFQSISYRMGKDFALKSFYKLLTGEKSYRDLYWRGLPGFLKHLTKAWLGGIMKPHEGGNRGSASERGTFTGKR